MLLRPITLLAWLNLRRAERWTLGQPWSSATSQALDSAKLILEAARDAAR